MFSRFWSSYYLLRRYDVASYGVVVVDVASHRFECCNARFVDGMGYSEAILKTWCLEDSVIGEDQLDMTEIFAKVKNGNIVKGEDIRMQSSHGVCVVRWEFEGMGDKLWGRCYFL